MAYDIASLKTTRRDDPPRILIYGPEGFGKTSLAAEFPAPVIADIERGTPIGVDVPGADDIESYDQLMEFIKALAQQDHGYRTFILDTLDRLEPLVWAKTCEVHNWSSIEDPGYGKGYVEADAWWSKIVAACNYLRTRKGMTIIYVAHSTIERFDDPTSAPYSRYDVRLHKRAEAIFKDDVDAILFLNQELSVKAEDVGFKKTVRRAEGGDVRWINCAPNPAYTAKNRFGLPDRVLYQKGQGYAQLAPYLPGRPQPPASAPKSETAKEAA
jgi:hypothetical protein